MHITGNDPASKPQPTLQRSLSLSLVIYYGLGNILGAGVYVLIGKVAAYAGYQAPLSFLLASLLAGFTAFSYAELSARYPFSAGEVMYIQNGLGIRPLAILTGLLIIMAVVLPTLLWTDLDNVYMWTAVIATLLFGAFQALETQLGGGQLLPPTVVQSLPFILTMLVLAGFVGRSVAPKAIGKPFEKG